MNRRILGSIIVLAIASTPMVASARGGGSGGGAGGAGGHAASGGQGGPGHGEAAHGEAEHGDAGRAKNAGAMAETGASKTSGETRPVNAAAKPDTSTAATVKPSKKK
jgi:hypothetical protein